MNHEARQYRVVRWTTALTGGGGLLILGTVIWYQWRSIGPYLFSHQLGCGCQTLSIHLSPWMIGWTSLLTVLGLVMFGRFAWQLSRHAWRQHRFRQQAEQLGRPVTHRETGVTFWYQAGTKPSAMTLGFIRPIIVVTSGLRAQVSNREFGMILRHEQVHQRQADPGWSVVLAALGAAWWWMPWVRTWIAAAWRLRELTADELAIVTHQDREALGGALVKIASRGPAMEAAFSPNQDRIEKMLDQSWRPKLHLWQKSAILTAVASVISLGFFWQVMTATAQTLQQIPVGACQETQRMCANQSQFTAPQTVTLCRSESSWHCATLPAMSVYEIRSQVR